MWLEPGSIFFEIRLYFSKIACNSADTAAIILRFTDELLSIPIFGKNWRSAVFCQETPVMSPISYKKDVAELW